MSIGGLVPWHPEAGGGQIIAYKISEALASAGHSVHYLAIGPQGHERQVEWGQVEYILSGPGLLEALRLAPQLASSESRNEYDIVHVHLGGETIGHCLAYTFARRMGLRARVVLSIYAPRAYAFPRSLGEVITALSCHNADLVFCLSEFSKRDIARAYRVPLSKMDVTYAGVDSSFSPSASPPARGIDDPFSLLFCGRLNGPHEQKGVDVLLHSLPTVLKTHKAVLNIIGTGPRLAQYRALSEELGIADQVRFLGFVEHQDLPEQYHQVDLFVLPSRRESFGLVLPEAMACGVPVVATTAGAIPEVVENGVTGLLVPPDDPEVLGETINSMLNDHRLMKALSAKAREAVGRRFTWEKVAERVVRAYQRVLQG